MKAGQFIYQVQKLAGDPDGKILSQDLLLLYMSEEMRMVAEMFPHELTLVETLSGDTMTGAALIKPHTVWVNGNIASKAYYSDIERIREIGSVPGYIYWAEAEGQVYIVPGSGDVRVIGHFRPPEYALADMDKNLIGPSLDAGANEIAALDGLPLSVVRYRMLYRAAEEAQQFDRAQYYLAISDKRERDVRRHYQADSSTSTGFVHGQDF